jgi:hypothetical protein
VTTLLELVEESPHQITRTVEIGAEADHFLAVSFRAGYWPTRLAD